MNSVSPPSDLPVRPVNSSGVKQLGVPSKWHDNRSAIGQVDSQRVLFHGDIDDPLACSRVRSSHATP
jgi:hypothetical protein